MNMKLSKFYVGEIIGIIATDMVFYKNEDGKLYRLRYLKSPFDEYLNQIDRLEIFACIAKYAPDILEGEIVQDNNIEVHIKTERGIYILDKNVEKWSSEICQIR
jgi:hypothetical protein